MNGPRRAAEADARAAGENEAEVAMAGKKAERRRRF